MISFKSASDSDQLIYKAAQRIAWYPAVPLFTTLPLVLLCKLGEKISPDLNNDTWKSIWALTFFGRAQSIGYALVFYFDPTVAFARERFRADIVESQVIKYHPIGMNDLRSIQPLPMTKKESFFYYFYRYVFGRKRDFVTLRNKRRILGRLYYLLLNNRCI